MFAYERYSKVQFRYPDEMERILKYLNKNGKLMISDTTVEEYYRDFSDEKYDAGWMGVTDELIEQFANWLEKKRL